MATFRKRGKSWQAQVRRGGTVKAKTFRTKAQAEAWARDVEDQLIAGEYVDTSASEAIQFGDLLDLYEEQITPRKKSIRVEKSKIKMIKTHLGKKRLRALTADVIVDYVDMRRKTCKAETIRKELSTISHVLKVSQALWGVRIKTDPVKQAKTILSVGNALEPGERRDRRLTRKEYLRLKNDLPICAKAAFILAVETAMRRGEILNIRRHHIRGTTLHIAETKTGESRIIPLSRKARRVLKVLNGDPLFSVMPDSITQAFERSCARLKIHDLKFHDLRHEATSRLFERGWQIHEVAIVTGHKSWESLKRYTNLKASDLVHKM